jgi:hypothetical protein
MPGKGTTDMLTCGWESQSNMLMELRHLLRALDLLDSNSARPYNFRYSNSGVPISPDFRSSLPVVVPLQPTKKDSNAIVLKQGKR